MFCSKPLRADIDDSLFTGNRYSVHESTIGLHSESTLKNKFILVIYFKTPATVCKILIMVVNS